jgi:DNA repair exonuclease SbcCD ATPase subunit
LLSIINVGRLSNQLERLNLSQNRLTDISPIADVTSLKQLNLAENHIQCLNGLDQLYRIEVLNLAHNNIADCESLSPLKALENLHDLSLLGNPICSIVDYENMVFSYLPKLCYLDGLSRENVTMLPFFEKSISNPRMFQNIGKNTAGEIRQRPEELIDRSERASFLEARIHSMENAFSLQEEALANGNHPAHAHSSMTHRSESCAPYLNLLRLWRCQAYASMTQLVLTRNALQEQGLELKAQRVSSSDALREAQLTALSWKERSIAADEKARSFEAIIAQLQCDVDNERQKVKVAQNESLNARKSEACMRTLLLESLDKLQEQNLGATLNLEEGMKKLNALRNRIAAAADRVNFSAALVAQREVYLRNSMAMHTLTSVNECDRVPVSSPGQSSEIPDSIRQARLQIRPEAESLLRSLFKSLDGSGRGVVPRDLLLLCLGDDGCDRKICDFNISSLTSLILEVLGKPHLEQALSGLRSILKPDVTWGEFLLQMVAPTGSDQAVPLTDAEHSELGRSGAWGDVHWGLIPLQTTNTSPDRSDTLDEESVRLARERAALLRMIHDLNTTMERRAQICKAHFMRETRTTNLQVMRLQGQVAELTASLESNDQRYVAVTQLHVSQRELLEGRLRALEAELSEFRSKANLKDSPLSDLPDNTIILEKSKYQRMEKEYSLMQREMGRIDVLNKGLERDVRRITVSLNSLMSEKERLEGEVSACERQLEAITKTHDNTMAEVLLKSSALQSDLENKLKESETRLEKALENISRSNADTTKSDSSLSGLRSEMESLRSIPVPVTVLDSSNSKNTSGVYAAHLERLLRLAEEAIGQ